MGIDGWCRARSASRRQPPSTSARPRFRSSGSGSTEALQTVTGQDLKPVYVLLDGESEAAEAPAPAVKDEGVDEEALLERLKSEFDAEEVS